MELENKKDLEFRGKPSEDVAQVASFTSYDLFLSRREDCVYVYPMFEMVVLKKHNTLILQSPLFLIDATSCIMQF